MSAPGYSSTQNESLAVATGAMDFAFGGINKSKNGIDPRWLIAGIVIVAGIWIIGGRR